MRTPIDRPGIASINLCCVIAALCALGLTQLRAEEPDSSSSATKPLPQLAENPLHRNLIGVWTRRAVPYGGAPQVEGRQYKFFGDKYWVATHSDDSGYMIYAVGGTYDLVDGNYTEYDKFGTLYCQGLIGGVFNFKIDVDSKKFWQIGMNNEYTEKYRRVAVKNEPPLALSLRGAWTRTAPSANAPQGQGVVYKFLDAGRWIRLDTDKDGLALTAHGGTYKLAYDVLLEKTTSSTDFTAHPIGEVTKSKVVVKDQTILLTGVDDKLTEEWTRAK
jgi:hypothetical protein